MAMSEEEIQNLNENLKQLNDTIKLMNDTMSAVTNQSTLAANATSKLKASVNNTVDDIDDLAGSTINAKGALDNLEKSTERTDDAFEAYRKSTLYAITTITGFGDALLSTEKGLNKYSGTLGEAGKAVSALGDASTPVTRIFSRLFNLSMILAGEWLKQTDFLLSYSDTLSKMGAANTFTAEDIRLMGKDVGLTSETLSKLITPLSNLGPATRALGATTEQSVRAFTDMNSVTQETREAFQRLGLDDEGRIQATADYVSLLYKSNTYLSVQQRTQDNLIKQAKAYTENLYVLAELSGTDIKTAKEQLEVAKATMLWKLQENKWAQEQIRLEKAGDTEGLARLAAEREGAEKMMSDLAVINDPIITAAMQMKFLTGATTELASGLMIAGVDIDGMVDAAKNNELAQGQLVDHVSERQQNMINTMGHSVFGLSEELRNATNINEGSMDRLYRRSIAASEGLDAVEIASRAAARILANTQGEGPVADDAPHIVRNFTTEIERATQLLKDEFVADTNPLLKGLNDLTMAVIALTALMGASTLAGPLKGAVGMLNKIPGLGKSVLDIGRTILGRTVGPNGPIKPASLLRRGAMGLGAAGAVAGAGMAGWEFGQWLNQFETTQRVQRAASNWFYNMLNGDEMAEQEAARQRQVAAIESSRNSPVLDNQDTIDIVNGNPTYTSGGVAAAIEMPNSPPVQQVPTPENAPTVTPEGSATSTPGVAAAIEMPNSPPVQQVPTPENAPTVTPEGSATSTPTPVSSVISPATNNIAVADQVQSTNILLSRAIAVLENIESLQSRQLNMSMTG